MALLMARLRRLVAVADQGIVGAVIGGTGSHTENKDLDQEENNQP